MVGDEETKAIKRKLTGFIQANTPQGGTVQSDRPDAWAWLIGLALVAVGASLGLAIAAIPPGVGWTTPLALTGLALAVVAVVVRAVKR